LNVDDNKPWQHRPSESFTMRATPLSVFKTLIPYIVLITVGASLFYYRNGSLSNEWVWTLIAIGAGILAASFFLPTVNYLEFTPHHLTVCQVLSRQQFAGRDIVLESISCTRYTLLFIPMFTKINFDTIQRVSLLEGHTVSFVNIFDSTPRVIEFIQLYQRIYGG
jgi:hypothetical protein